jgi:predicted O-methyltransferase YrrM
MKIVNLSRNALRPSYLTVMLGKAVRRLEPSTKAQAVAWAEGRSITIDRYCAQIDAALWNASCAAAARMRDDANRRLAGVRADLGGAGSYPLLYFLTRMLRPETVVETGVAAGWSSRAILEALDANGAGTLYSSDFPYFRLANPERYIGVVVPVELRDRWVLDVRGDKKALPHIADQVDRIDLFHYDSDKSVHGRAYALSVVEPRFHESTAVIMDDIDDNTFFKSAVESREREPTVIEFEGKHVGAWGLPSAVS